MQREHPVIVGAGPAGVAAAVQCKRLGFSPVLLEATGRAGGLVENAFFVENYPCIQPVDGPAFARGLRRHLERFGIVVQQATVERAWQMADDGWCLETDQGELRARAVIVASGTTPIPLEIEGAAQLNGQGLFYEVRQVLAYLDGTTDGPTQQYRAEKAGSADLVHRRKCLLIGGGEASLDYALTLARRQIQSVVYVRRNRLKARGRLVEIAEQCADINLVFAHEPRRLRRSERGIAVEFETPRGIVVEGASAVLAAIGRRQTLNKLLKGLDVYPVRTVSTRFPGLYIVGDARLGSLGQAGIAVGDGLAASMAACTWLEQL